MSDVDIRRDAQPFEEWQSDVEKLLVEQERQGRKSIRFELGDKLIIGERSFGSTYSEWIKATGKKSGDLRSMASVARRVPVVNRLTSLSWSHHAVVADLPEKPQREWLLKAADQGWSKAELRRQLIQERVVIVISPNCTMCGGIRFDGDQCMRCDEIKRRRQSDPDSVLVLLDSNADDAAKRVLERRDVFTDEYLCGFVRKIATSLNNRQRSRERREAAKKAESTYNLIPVITSEVTH